MAVPDQTGRISYVGDGIAATFAFPWLALGPDDLLVIVRTNASGLETQKYLNIDYTISGVGNPAGGSITFITALPQVTETIWIIMAPRREQGLDLVPGSAFPAEAFEAALDRLMEVAQRNRSLIDRSLLMSETDITGGGAYDAEHNRITNLGDPVDGDDAVSKDFVLAQTINTNVPLPGSVGDFEADASDPFATDKVQGLTAAEQAVETNPSPAADSDTIKTQLEKYQYVLKALLNLIDGGARANYYTSVPATSVPAQISAAIASLPTIQQNLLFNGSQFVSQRFPSETATGTVASGIDAYVTDRWFVFPTGGTVTWKRENNNTRLHSAARSRQGMRFTGAAGITNVRFGQRIGKDLARALGANRIALNITFGCKVKHDGTTGSITPNFYVNSTSNNNPDYDNTKFAAANMTNRIAQAFPGALGPTDEVEFTKTFDIAGTADLEKGFELIVDFGAMNAATIEFTITDCFLAFADITTNMLPDDFALELERSRRYYQKTFDYNVQPVQNAGYIGALCGYGASAVTREAIGMQHAPGLRGIPGSAQVTTYNPGAAANTPRTLAGVDGTRVTADDQIGVNTSAFGFTSGAANATYFMHATLDAEWYD